jgi:hypothetical protein
MTTVYFCISVECDLTSMSSIPAELPLNNQCDIKQICTAQMFLPYTVPRSHHILTYLWLTLVHVNSIMCWICLQVFCDISHHNASVMDVKAASTMTRSSLLVFYQFQTTFCWMK